MTDGVDIHTIGRTGRITLNRPGVLNALDHAMSLAIERALDRWANDDGVDMVLIDSAGGRAFCAGGDIAALYASGRAGDFASARRFWADEYRLNAKLACYDKPYVALMDGIVMGGGCGISVHGTHRVVTQRSMIAMPECAIGLVPDVGLSLALARAPGRVGEFLAMTGWRIDGDDAVAFGLADVVVDAANLPELAARLEAGADPEAIAAFAKLPGAGSLAPHLDLIDRHFSHETAYECLLSLETDTSEFAGKAASMIRRASALSLACSLALIRTARGLPTVRDALRHEYRFTFRSMSDGDFLEGVRAQIIDKDRRPDWRFKSLHDVDRPLVDAMLAPLGADELDFSEQGDVQ